MQLGMLAFTEASKSFQQLVLRTYTFHSFFFKSSLFVRFRGSVCNYLLLPKNPSNRSICVWFCTGPRWKPSLMIITVGLPSTYSVQ